MNMVFHPSRGKAGLLGLTLTASFFVLIGCSNNEPSKDANSTPPNTGGTPPTSGMPSTPGGASASNDPGQAVFSSKCAGCHSINGVGGKKGPDLSKAGAEAKHTPEW